LSLLLKDVAGEFVLFVLAFESMEEYQPENVFGAAKTSNNWKEKSTTMHDKKTSITLTRLRSKQRGSSTILTLLWVIRNLSASETMTSSCSYITM